VSETPNPYLMPGDRADRAPREPRALPYQWILRGGRDPGWAWAILGICALAIVVLIAQLVPMLGVMAYYLGRGDTNEHATDLLAGDPVTPSFLLGINLGWGLSILAAWLVIWLVNGLKPRWLTSVATRVRWAWFFSCFGLAVVALIATVVVSAFLPAGASDGSEMSGQLNSFTSATRDFLIVIILFTPLQAAGEEYVFRGYLTQAVGAWFPWERAAAIAAVLVPAVLFAVAHGVQEWPIFINRLAFGVIAGILVLRTGGLEAGIAMHILNNFLAFGFALAFGDMTESLNPEGSSWWSLVPTLTQSLVYLGLCLFVARLMGVRTTTDATVLAAPPPRV